MQVIAGDAAPPLEVVGGGENGNGAVNKRNAHWSTRLLTQPLSKSEEWTELVLTGLQVGVDS